MERTEVFIGIDAGTQSLKVCAFNDSLELLDEAAIHFDEELAEYGTHAGQVNLGGGVVRAPAAMWFEGLDLALLKLKDNGKVDLTNVVAISGDAQQHSSVWWKAFPKAMDPSTSLKQVLSDAFAVEMSPVWADSSTTEECLEAEARIGGRAVMAKKTGSVATERFTGNQIAKLYKTNPEQYETTELIQLLSAALCSVLVGEPVPADYSDAAGMNMLDLSKGPGCYEWLSDLDHVFGVPGLQERVGDVCHSVSVAGSIAPYFVERHGLPHECKIVTFTGDNPATLVGTTDKRSDVVISLGTSDTVLSQIESIENLDVSEGGFSIFPHPLEQEMFMLMICYKNGGAVRAMEKTDEKTWDQVEQALRSPVQGEEDVLLFSFPQTEIAPRPIQPCRRAFSCISGEEVPVTQLSWSQKIRGVMLARALSIKAHLGTMGCEFDRVILTGGGSKSEATRSLFQEILCVPVVALRSTASAARGSALKAKLALHRSPVPVEYLPTTLPVQVPDLDIDMYLSLEDKL